MLLAISLQLLVFLLMVQTLCPGLCCIFCVDLLPGVDLYFAGNLRWCQARKWNHLPYELSQKSVLINGQGLVVVNLQVFEAHCVPHTMHTTFLCHSSFFVMCFCFSAPPQTCQYPNHSKFLYLYFYLLQASATLSRKNVRNRGACSCRIYFVVESKLRYSEMSTLL